MAYNDSVLRGTDPSYQTGANAANPLIPVEVTEKIIKGATAKSVVMRLANTMRMSRHLKTMPVLNTLPSTYWVSDPMGLKQTTRVDWRNVILTAEELAALVVVPDVVLKDANTDVWAQIRPLMEEAIGKAVDEAILFGINKPASWPDDLKTAAIAAGNTVTEGTGIDIAADFNNVMAGVEIDGYGVTDAAMQMRLKGQFRGLRSTTNEFLFKPNNPGVEDTMFGKRSTSEEGDLMGVHTVIARNGAFEAEDDASANAVSLIAGDWSQIAFAIREDMNIDFSNSAVIHNSEGAVQFNAWQQDATIMRVIFRCAYAVPNPINRLAPTQATRFPFSVMREAA